MKFKIKKPQRHSKAKQHHDKMKWIQKKVRTGELDLTKKSHLIPYKVAVSKGIIKKEDKDA